MRYPLPTLLFILTASICSANEPDAQKPIDIAINDLAGNHSLLVTSSTGDALEVSTYSGALSKWNTVTPPIKISSIEVPEISTIWAPDSEATSEKWILITYQDTKTKEQKVRAFPSESILRSESTLFIINLTSLELKGRSGGGELWLKPYGQTFLETRKPNVSVQLKATESPHYSQVSLSELDADQSFLLLFTYPHIQGSALLSHRLVRLPNLK